MAYFWLLIAFTSSDQCTMPGGSKGRTAKTAMKDEVEQVLKENCTY